MYQTLILILADGARADVMADLMKRGQLPALSETLGNFYEATTAFPSTTGPAYLPFLTGDYPGSCNLPGIRWFDKSEYARTRFSHQKFRSYVGAATLYINGDIAPPVTTLFEKLRPSANIFSSVNRGVSFRGNKTLFFRIWYWYYAHLTDHWGLVDHAARRKLLQALEEDFRFIFVVFPGIDEFSHLQSPFSERVREAYQDLDRAVAEVVKKLKAAGRWEESCLMIVSDHGLSETRRHLGLNRFLEEEMGIPTLYYPKTVFKNRFGAASMVSGNAMAHLYLRNGEGGRGGWEERTPWEALTSRKDHLLDRLLEKEEVDLVAGQSEDGSIVVKSRKGEGRISGGAEQALPLRYTVHGSDPFGYPSLGKLPSGKLPLPETMTVQEALEKTFETNYPDALMQLAQIFRSRRTGDLVLSAGRGFDLRQRFEIHEHKASHGSLDREQMMIPVVTNAKLPAKPFRSVDLFPTLLKLLGEEIPSGIDGASLLA